MTTTRGSVALFVTCLVDLMRPRVGVAAAKLLRDAGFEVHVPAQGCCGQPNYNNGDRTGAARLVLALEHAFENFAAVVAPSGSCASMLATHGPTLFEQDSMERRRAESLAAKTHELTSFLSANGYAAASFPNRPLRMTYHDGCSGLRELGVKRQPRELLARIPGLDLVEMADAGACCGFGGTFCVKYGAISNRMVEQKAADIEATGAELVCCGDVGCLLNIEGKLHRRSSKIAVRHVAEILAGLEE